MRFTGEDAIARRVQAFADRISAAKANDEYFYNQAVRELHGGARVLVNGREMGMYASYSYLGLIGHPRINKAAKDAIDRYGIALEKLYLDPMIEPLSVRSDGGMMSVHTLLGLKRQLPEIKTIISLSGISFGLPERKLLHRSFMPMLMYAGLDAVFLDPLDTLLMQCVIASQALLDQDEFCMNYITASREGKLSS